MKNLFLLQTQKKETAFESFWKMYPRRVSRKAAEKAWMKTGAEHAPETRDEILAGLRKAVIYWQQKGTAPEFIPHAASWLNAERWTDELDVKIDEAANLAKCSRCENRGWTQRIDPARGSVMTFCDCPAGEHRKAEVEK